MAGLSPFPGPGTFAPGGARTSLTPGLARFSGGRQTSQPAAI